MSSNKVTFELLCFCNKTEVLIGTTQFESNARDICIALGLVEGDLYDSYLLNVLNSIFINELLSPKVDYNWDFERYSYFVELA